MARQKDSYKCSACDTIYSQWRGQCSACSAWNTIELVSQKNTTYHTPPSSLTVHSLRDITVEHTKTLSTNVPALDAIFGNGIVSGSSILLGGEPGIGKSTFVLQLASLFAKQGYSILYASGEESASQISLRAQRLGIHDENIFLLATSSLQDVLHYLSTHIPHILLIDSVQTFTTNTIEGFAGNINQVKAVASECIDFCKQHNIAVIFIGHITKEGALAGPKVLEHLVDAVFSFDGDRKQVFRILRIIKNRFGSTQELGVFQMEEQGLRLIEDPSTYFLEERDSSLSGTAIVMTTEGQLAFAVEVQALVTHSYLTMPRRIALGYDSNRLALLLAVMEKRLRCNFGELDIHTKIGGGLRSNDPAIDLALVVAILSSMYDIPLPERSIVWGEVDLNGQIRPVANHELRYQHANRLGYTPIIAPKYKQTGLSSLTELGFLFKK